MIPNAVYREGVATSQDGAVYVVGLASGEVVNRATDSASSAIVNGGLFTRDGALVVRYV